MDEDTIPFGLLGYPVLQAADILLPRAHLVPVGKDNQAHVEITRELARRFNSLYGEVFPVPDDLVEGDTLVGTDGQAKMSKSLGNAIFLSDRRRPRCARKCSACTRTPIASTPTSRARSRAIRSSLTMDMFNPDTGRGGRAEGALPAGQGGRRGGQGAAGGGPERVPGSGPRAHGLSTSRRVVWSTRSSTTARCACARWPPRRCVRSRRRWA